MSVIHISQLRAQNPDDLAEAQALNADIFAALAAVEDNAVGTAGDAPHFDCSDVWWDRLTQKDGQVWVAHQSAVGLDTGAATDAQQRLVGFLFVYRKRWSDRLVWAQEKCNLGETWHVWLAGVTPEGRGQNILGKLFQAAQQDRSRFRPDLCWSVNTKQAVFKSMVRWLQKTHWVKVKEDAATGKSTWVWTGPNAIAEAQ